MPGIGDKNVTVFIGIETNADVQLKKTGRQIEQFAGRAERTTKRASRSFLRLGATLRGTASIVSRLTGRWTAMLGTIGGTFVIFKATSDAQKFGLAMAEVGTIFEGTEEQLVGVRSEVLRLSEALGFVETIAAKGFYQIISADITDAADAQVILRESAELAAVGLADIKDTINVVVSAVKAYNSDVEDAAHITDVLFQTVVKGRTTIPELATSLGQVLPIAATLGIRLEEVTGAIATLTQGGIDTNVAVIQIRQAMNQLLKLTPTATATLKAFGLEITTASIAEDGFAETIFKISDALGGNATALAKVFGNIRALIPVLALTGERADQFRSVLDAMENSSGRVGRSLDKLLANPFKRFQVFLNAIRLRLREVGEAFIEEFNKVLDAQGGVTAVVDRLATVLEALKPIAASVAKTFGDVTERIGFFIERSGGLEAAGRVMKALGAVVGALGRALAQTFINTLNIAISVLAQLPRLLTAVTNDFKRFRNEIARALDFAGEVDLPFPELAPELGGIEGLRDLEVELLRVSEIIRDIDEGAFKATPLQADIARIGAQKLADQITEVKGNLESLEGVVGLHQFSSALRSGAETAGGARARVNELAADIKKLDGVLAQSEAFDRTAFGPEGVSDVLLSPEFLGVFDDGREQLLRVLGDVDTKFGELGDASAAAAAKARASFEEMADAVQLVAVQQPPAFGIIQEGVPIDSSEAKKALASLQADLKAQALTSGLALELGLELDPDAFQEIRGPVSLQLDRLRAAVEAETGIAIPLQLDAESAQAVKDAFLELLLITRELDLEAGGGAAAELEFLERSAKIRRDILEDTLAEQGVIFGSAQFERALASFDEAERRAKEVFGGDFTAGFRRQIELIGKDLDDLFARGAQFASDLTGALQGGLETGLAAMLKGESDAFQQFKDTLANGIAEAAARGLSDALTDFVLTGVEAVLPALAPALAPKVAGEAAGEVAGEVAGEAATSGIDSAALLTAFTPVVTALTEGSALLVTAASVFDGAAGGMAAAVTVMSEATISIAASAVEIAIAAKAAAVPVAMGGFLAPQPESSIQSFAAGGVPERRRIQRITGGGVVRQKSLFEVGEAGQDELVVPLPGNRKVPVEMRGGSTSRPAPGPTINVSSVVNLNVTSDDRSFSQRLAQSMPEVERNITATLEQGINRALESSIRGVARGA